MRTRLFASVLVALVVACHALALQSQGMTGSVSTTDGTVQPSFGVLVRLQSPTGAALVSARQAATPSKAEQDELLAATRQGAPAEPAIRAVAVALAASDPAVRRTACDVLTSMALLGAGSDPAAGSSWRERRRSAQGLTPSLRSLIDRDPDERVRVAAVAAAVVLSLDNAGPGRGAVAPDLEAQLRAAFARDDSARVRSAVVGALAATPLTPTTRMLLVEALGDRSPAVVQVAAQHIARGQVVEAVPALQRILDNPSADVRTAAAQALGALGPAARAAVLDLKKRSGIETNEVTARTIRGALAAISE